MELAFSTSQSGLHATNQRQEVIAHNLANISTNGYKVRRAELATMWGPGTKLENVVPRFTLGSPLETQIDTDFYLAGNGFFQVQLESQTAYTRDGSFRIDESGQMVNSSGYLLEPGITVPEGSVGLEVRSDGLVFTIDGDGNATQIGELQIATFINPAGLVDIGDNLYIEGINSGPPQEGQPGEEGFATILQRYVEQSNVEPTEEMTELLKNNRAYQLNLRVFQTADDAVGRSIDLFS